MTLLFVLGVNWVLDTALWIDRRMGWVTDYEYETASYCGNHYNGHRGKLTASDYHEGDGGEHTVGPVKIIRMSDGWVGLRIPYLQELRRRVKLSTIQLVPGGLFIIWYGPGYKFNMKVWRWRKA